MKAKPRPIRGEAKALHARGVLSLSVFMALLLVSGCSSFPDIQGFLHDSRLSGDSLIIRGAGGALSPAERAQALSATAGRRCPHA